MLEALKERVCRLNGALPRYGLVTMTSGNVSGRDEASGLVVIKPSGVAYEDMTPDDMVVVHLDGHVVEGTFKPSVDTATHLYIYRHRPDIHGVVHTHSNYATSFAAVGQPVPVVLTAIADEFGGPIPVGPYVSIGDDGIGRAIVEHIGHSPSILMKQHGIFALGPTPEAALKAAVMTEDVAKTVHLAWQIGRPDTIPQEEVLRGHRQYMTHYGQLKTD